MVYTGWLCLGNQQIVNDCRTIQRVADGFGPPGLMCRACDPCCGDVSAGLGYPNGYNPTELPWFDGSQDSVDAAGLLITSIEGLEPGEFKRPVTESAGYGAVIGQGRQSAPTIVVEGLIMAATCCSQDFFLRWLRGALRGSCASSTNCNGDDLIFLACEPQTPDLDCPSLSYDDEVLADGPLIYYKMDEAGLPVDYSGNGRNADFAEGTPAAALHSGSIASREVDSFTTNYVADVYTYGPFGTTAGVSMEAWIQMDADDGILTVYETTDTPTMDIRLWKSPRAIQKTIIDFGGGNSASFDTPELLADGAVHYVVATWDNTTLRLYVDGVLYDSANSTLPDSLNADEMYGFFDDSSGVASTKVDSFALYGTALSAERIAAHYAAGLSSGSGAFDYAAWLAPYYRTMKGVALIDGPHVIEKISRACSDCADCQIYKVQFTLAASKPCVFTDPVTIEPEFMTFTCGALGTDCIEWVSDEDCDPDDTGCPELESCATDPDCVSTIAPPSVPPISNPCVEECISVFSCQVCADIPAGTFSQNAEGTLIVQIYAGSAPLRRINLKVWQNPLDFDADQLSDCDVCSELNISYLGAGATLTIDGTTRTATIDCPNSPPVRANPFIASGTGSPSFSFPDFDGCVGQYTVCITTAGGAAIDSYVSLQAVGREC